MLLQHRADANKARNDCTTPLQFAAHTGLRGGGRGVAGVSRGHEQGRHGEVDSASPGRLRRPRRRCSPPPAEPSGHHFEGPVERYSPGERSTGRPRRGGDASGPSGGGWRPSVKTLTTEIFLSIFRVCVAARNGILGLVGHPIFFNPFASRYETKRHLREPCGFRSSP